MDSISPDPESEPLKEVEEVKENKAAWWCWPVILIVLVLFAVVAPRLEEQSVDELSEEASDVSEEERTLLIPEPDWSQIAVLKLQGQMAIAASTVKKSDAEVMVKDLEASVSGPFPVASFAILVQFLDLDPGDALRSVEMVEREMEKEKAPKEFLTLVQGGMQNGVTDRERERLEKGVGWFAKLLPENSKGEKTDSPFAEKVRNKAFVVLAVVGVVFGIGIFAMIAGAILLTIYLTMRSGDPQIQKFNPKAGPSGVLLEAFAIYLAIMAFGEIGGHFLHWTLSIICYPLSFIVAIFWPKIRGYNWATIRESIGWHRGRGFFREVGAGIVSYIGILPIAAIGITLTGLLLMFVEYVPTIGAEAAGGEAATATEGRAVPHVSHPIIGAILQGGILIKLLCLLLASGFAPFIEETLFRGALHRHLRGRLGFLVAALIGGLVFAALHPQGWIAIPALTGMGIGFALIREWRDSLIAPMVAHAINNGLIVGLFAFLL